METFDSRAYQIGEFYVHHIKEKSISIRFGFRRSRREETLNLSCPFDIVLIYLLSVG